MFQLELQSALKIILADILIIDFHGQHQIVQTLDIVKCKCLIVLWVAGAFLDGTSLLSIGLVKGSKVVLFQFEDDVRWKKRNVDEQQINNACESMWTALRNIQTAILCENKKNNNHARSG